MSGYEENIDSTYDSAFNEIDGLTWFPWVGRSYGETDVKIFVLGESHYNSKPDASHADKIAKNKAFTREVHQTHAMGMANGKKTRYVRNFERALFHTKSPSVKTVNAFWVSVIYSNLVLSPMSNKKKRPTYADYFDGWKVFVQLAELLQPAQCIVYGLEGDKMKALKDVGASMNIPSQFERLSSKVGRSHPKKATLSLDYGKLNMLFIRHPSQYFSWSAWSEVLDREIQLPDIKAA